MALKLNSVQKYIESQMQDEFVLSRDPEGYSDDVWNPVTLRYDHPIRDREEVYRGPGLLVPVDTGVAQINPEGGQNVEILRFDLFIPLMAAKIEKWDLVFCSKAVINPHLISKRWFVESDVTGSYAVAQQLRLVDRMPQFMVGQGLP